MKKRKISHNIPNATTRAAIQDVRHRKNLTKTSLKQLSKGWDKECVHKKIFNAKTKNVLQETEKGIGLIKCKNTEDMFKKLGI